MIVSDEVSELCKRYLHVREDEGVTKSSIGVDGRSYATSCSDEVGGSICFSVSASDVASNFSGIYGTVYVHMLSGKLY